jgi:hypothetical protein
MNDSIVNMRFTRSDFDAYSDTKEEPFEQQCLYKLHDMCDKLKKADRKEFLDVIKREFKDAAGIGRFIEIEEFKEKVHDITSQFKKKLPKRKKTVFLSDNESE